MIDITFLAIDHATDGDFARWIWIVFGILGIIALAIWILRNLR